jgi:peptide chain release factor 3
MLIDAAKGLEPQTLKLFQVCRHRGIPVITVINKWDRPGRSPLELLDEIQDRIGLHPTPLTWPVGIAGDFRGVLDRRTGQFIRFTRTAGGAKIAPEEQMTAVAALEREGQAWSDALEDDELLAAAESDHDHEAFLAGRTTPVLFAAAVLNFGVSQLLDVLLTLAPPPAPRPDIASGHRPIEAPFSAFVFKVQAGMDSAHRDRLAFARVCSGVFERGMTVTHAATGRTFATKYVHTVFGRERTTVDVAFPGDVIGLVNASALRVGDSLYIDVPVEFPPIPNFAPEHFAVIRAKDTGRYKQFRRGVEQLEQEGVIQVLRSDLRGDQAPVLAAVGPMQFEVATHRMESEFGAPVHFDKLEYQLARRTRKEDVAILNQQRGVEVLNRGDGALLALFPDKWRLATIERDLPDLVLEPLVASSD